MKTATIKVREVFGTNGRTVAAEVTYRGKRVWFRMANETASVMLAEARIAAHTKGFTHTKIEY